MATKQQIKKFQNEVIEYWQKNGRHELPWRKTKDPYKILVSEIMLQQTQVKRVLEKYKEFLMRFPNINALAHAPLSAVLKVWSGLGYNRRGKYLHDAAKIIVSEYKGNMKKALANSLPGVGPYTRAAVRTFAYNESHSMIETNIRTVFIHHFFSDVPIVEDRLILVHVEEAAKNMDPRTWYWALMDYGSYLKTVLPTPSRKSAHHTTQSKFEGSLRQVRGAILKLLNESSQATLKIYKALPFEKERIDLALAGLTKDGMITKIKNSWRIS
jgi:A/G-specific adenine glycosylase